MFGKKKEVDTKLGSSFDRLLNHSFKKDEDMDSQLLDLADILIANRPLLLNFEEIRSLNDINHVVSFLAGVVYALGGEVHRLGEETRLFATKVAFEDGTLHRYIKDFGIDQ